MFNNTLHPNRYHGFTAKSPYFEGWYYKLVSADGKLKIAIIPGVFLGQDRESSHCFIQVFESGEDQVRYHRYPFNDFQTSPDSFEIFVGPSYFSADRINLAIDDELGKLSGSLQFEELSQWPVSILSPGAMGWFAWVPFMECYHGVVSMDHGIQGTLKLDGKLLNFSDGRGYIEKDWGKQFPSAWIWGQSNHFSQPGISLMVSVAVVPGMGRSFGGFIIGFLFGGELYRFTTYNLSKIEDITINDTEVNLVVRNRTHRLKISALRERGVLLQAPTATEMDRRIIETMDARFEISFEDLEGNSLFRGTGEHAGLETVGDLDHLIKMVRQKVKNE